MNTDPDRTEDWGDGLVDVHGVTHKPGSAEYERLAVRLRARSDDNNKVAELARAAFALQELRYLAWTALKAWDAMSLRKAQRSGSTAAAMEAMRAALPTTPPDSCPSDSGSLGQQQAENASQRNA